MELGNSMLGQSGSSAWKVRAGKGGKYRLARNLGMCNQKRNDSKTQNLSTFSRWRHTTVRVRSCISPFPPFSESSIKTGLNQSAKKNRFFPSKKPESALKSPIPELGKFKDESLKRTLPWRRSGPSCVLPQGVPQGQTESGGILLAVTCWSPSAQRRCDPTERCAYRP
jgi:hypothetical protein